MDGPLNNRFLPNRGFRAATHKYVSAHYKAR